MLKINFIMNFKYYKFIFICLLFFLNLGSNLLILFTNQNYTTERNRKIDICHFGIPIDNKYINNKTRWHATAISNWNQSNDMFFMYKTRDTLNYKDHIRPFINSHIEIWHPKNLYGKKLFILRRKIMKIAKNIESCPNEPKYLLRTHAFCMIRKFLNKNFPSQYNNNYREEISKTAILFYLAEKYECNVRIRLLIIMNENDKPERYNLSVVRTKKEKNYYMDEILKKKFITNKKEKIEKLVKNDEIYKKSRIINKKIKKFIVSEYKCNLRFFIQENEHDVTGIKNYRTHLDKTQMSNISIKSQNIFITQNFIEKDVYIGTQDLYIISSFMD